MALFGKAMLAAYKAYGDCPIGTKIQPLHWYHYTTLIDGVVLNDQAYVICDYLSDNPLPGGWVAHDLVVAEAIKLTELDFLYIGGGSGRFCNAAIPWGQTGYAIDLDPQAIELMALRGVASELMDGNSMSFADDAYPLVVIAPAVFDASPDPDSLLAEAARVASERVIVSGGQAHPIPNPPLGEWPDPTPVHETLTWNGEIAVREVLAYHMNHAISMVEGAGMAIEKTVQFLPNLDHLDWVDWLIEGRV